MCISFVVRIRSISRGMCICEGVESGVEVWANHEQARMKGESMSERGGVQRTSVKHVCM